MNPADSDFPMDLPDEETLFLAVPPGDAPERIDRWIGNHTDISRSQVQKMLESGLILKNGKPCKPSEKVAGGDTVSVTIPAAQPLEAEPEDIPLDIVYEDRDLIVINKPRGMVVHPASGNEAHTLVNALLFHCTDLSGIGGKLRPGIVHRIDKDTTGLIVCAKNDAAHQSLSSQIAEHSAGRVYLALVEGVMKQPEGTVETLLGRHPTDRKKMAVVKSGGKEAVTHYRVLETYKNASLVQCRLATGRTHQIRVHMAHLGHPVVCDPVYGYKKQRFSPDGQLLHARELHFVHPVTGEQMNFSAPLPEDFERVLGILRREAAGG